MDALLRRKYENAIREIAIVEREDLDLVRSSRNGAELVSFCLRTSIAYCICWDMCVLL